MFFAQATDGVPAWLTALTAFLVVATSVLTLVRQELIAWAARRAVALAVSQAAAAQAAAEIAAAQARKVQVMVNENTALTAATARKVDDVKATIANGGN